VRNDVIALAKLRLEELLTFFEVNTTVEVTDDGEQIELLVPVDDGGRLIGRHGETLRAFQQIINTIVRGQTKEPIFISVDIAGYKKARTEAIETRAREAAERVIETGKPITLKPMLPAERRIVHNVLGEFPDIITESIGEDPNRQVVIKKRD
jgi:spoIIIJ-associated protein